jgi:RHS repeat-associated protein
MCCPLAKTREETHFAPNSGGFLFKKNAHRESITIFEVSRKELDEETGFYYYGARYLNPKTSVWISADPAVGDYIPSAPVNEEAKKRNGNLPGMGGVFNYVNFHVYHYAGNNPVRYVDPDGKIQRLSNGGIKFYPTSGQYLAEGQSGQTSIFQDGYILANDGTKIDVRYNHLRNIRSENFDCHGLTFTDGIFWINDKQIDKLLDADGYVKSTTPEIGNVMIQRNKAGEVIHSATVIGVDLKKGEVTVTEALGVIAFKQEDERLNRVRDYVYDINDESNRIEFYVKPEDKIVE